MDRQRVGHFIIGVIKSRDIGKNKEYAGTMRYLLKDSSSEFAVEKPRKAEHPESKLKKYGLYPMSKEQ